MELPRCLTYLRDAEHGAVFEPSESWADWNDNMKTLTIAIALLVLAGCDHKPRETFLIATTDGKRLRLTCPVVESSRSTFTYEIDGHCVVEPDK